MASASCGKKRSSSSGNKRKKRSKEEKSQPKDDVKAIKHYDVFYNQVPPGLIQEEQERPEDCIPDLPENVAARKFLASAPKKGLWMPLGREVKVMKCWRCKTYGHRTGDKECPLFISGNSNNEQFRYIHEDPMHDFVKDKKKMEKQESFDRVRQLQLLLEESTTSDSSSSSSSDETTTSSSSSSSAPPKRRKKRNEDEKSSFTKKHKRKPSQKKKSKRRK